MSYSVNSPCYKCSKVEDCHDGNLLSAAVSAIHAIGPSKGHLGGGTIDHKCVNFVDRTAVVAADEESKG